MYKVAVAASVWAGYACVAQIDIVDQFHAYPHSAHEDGGREGLDENDVEFYGEQYAVDRGEDPYEYYQGGTGGESESHACQIGDRGLPYHSGICVE